MKKFKPIIIVAGEPNSIFIEIFFKALKKKIKSPIILVASYKLLKLQMKKLKYKKKILTLDYKKLQNYINSLGNFIVSTSEMPDKKFTFTILDSPIVNAFALPGGYIYITRGLISLCQNEAQLAGVIAHEIGHVTARHAARRYTKSVGTGLLANILGSLTKNYLVRNLIGQSASLYLLSFSREQEYEADMLSTRYMIRAGFDPREMAMFLKNMEN